MYLIAGLGNPEKKYIGTRHNTGFAAVEALCEKLGGLKLNETKFQGVYTKARVMTPAGPEQLIIVKPLTYMNLSGNCIAPLANFYKIPAEQVIVVSDDINLAVGRMRIRKGGSAGGHNGLKSIIQCLGTDQFPRMRVGVGQKPEYMNLADYVLAKFDRNDAAVMAATYDAVADAILDIVNQGVEHAMNHYNPMNCAQA